MSGGARIIAVVTGSRADYGLLRPVMSAVAGRGDLGLRVVVCGAHLLPPALTGDEVAAEFEVDARLPMQQPDERGRSGYARALGRGVSGFAAYLEQRPPAVVVVLGDRIEAFAAAAAAAAMGVHIAHLHGGDREGIADESWRHAITKLAHLHLPATASSAQRIIRMGEDPAHVHVVGSPAIDGLGAIPPLPDERYRALAAPHIALLLHPSGGTDDEEEARAAAALRACAAAGPTLALAPNDDPGREGIARAIEASGCPRVEHLRRGEFVGLLRRLRVIVGNSSAGLIECAALPLWAINLGDRQGAREKPANVIDLPAWDEGGLRAALARLPGGPPPSPTHPYGEGRAGQRAAEILARVDLERCAVRKVNAY
jgi:UDP-hydrolysing UDP-N-acetyl-D-glucosamine 2-epimerase